MALFLLIGSLATSTSRADERELRRAEAAFRQGEFARAIAILEPLSERGEFPGDVARLLGHSYFALERRVDARDAYGRAISHGRLAEDVLLRAASIARDDGENARAKELLELAALVAPARRDIERSLARLALEVGDRARARSLLAEEIERDPLDVDARRLLANVRLESGETREALALYREAWHLRPEDPELARLIGDIAFREGDLEEVATWYERARREPEDPDIDARLARALWVGGDLPGALVLLERSVRALRARGESPGTELLVLLGRALVDVGRVEEGVTVWNEAARDGEASLDLSRYLAGHWLQRGDGNAARPHLERWLALDPEAVEATIALVRVHLGAGRVAEAREILRQSIARRGLTSDLRPVLGELARAA